jgi:hypothetical protein
MSVRGPKAEVRKYRTVGPKEPWERTSRVCRRDQLRANNGTRSALRRLTPFLEIIPALLRIEAGSYQARNAIYGDFAHIGPFL